MYFKLFELVYRCVGVVALSVYLLVQCAYMNPDSKVEHDEKFVFDLSANVLTQNVKYLTMVL